MTEMAMQTQNTVSSTVNAAFKQLRQELETCIIGQQTLVEHLLVALLADGHLLVEGAPGLAKTTAIKELAYRPQTGEFEFQRGPIFHNLVLADEINRAPAKVQSALLEAMGERQISVGQVTYTLPRLFLVMATQNPIEQEGTYPLPEAQLDRFLMHVRVGYPDASAEKQILDLNRQQARDAAHNETRAAVLLTQEQIFSAQQEVLSLHMAPAVEEYLIQILLASRDPSPYGDDLARWISYGASPRGTIALDRCARAQAWLKGRDYVSPQDIQAVVHDTLRHRILLSFEAEAEGLCSDDIIRELIRRVPVA